MKKIKSIVIGLLFLSTLFTSTTLFSQEYSGNEGRWYGGGTIGLSFSGPILSFSLMPEVAYAVTDDFYVGAGVGYSYYENRDNKRTINEWGGKLYLRYYVYNDFFAQVEYAPVYQNDSYYTGLSGSEWIYWDYFYGGVGYRSWIGGSSFMSVAILFDLRNLEEINFGYNPFIRFGIGIGI